MTEKESVVYERFVQLLINDLCGSGTNKSVRGGGGNHVRGASGHRHQIDVSIHSDSEIVLIECKHIGKNLEPQHVLTHAARLLDIRAGHPGHRVSASVVSIKSGSIGAKRIGDYFGVQVDYALNLEDYCITLKDRHHIGVISVANATDSAEADVMRRGG